MTSCSANIKRTARLLILLVFAVFVSSCVDSSLDSGSGLLPGDHDLKVKTSTKPVRVELAVPDSLQAANMMTIATGVIRHEVLGETEIISSVSFAPKDDSLRFGKDPIAKSFYMYLTENPAKKNFVNDEAYRYAPQNISIYRMNRNIDSTMNYNTSILPEYVEKDPVSVGTPVYMGQDSVKIYFDLDFAQELMTATGNELDTLSLFKKRFHPLIFKTDDYSTAKNSGRINHFKTKAEGRLEYSFIVEETGERKDTSITFVFGDTYPLTNGDFGSASLEGSNTDETIYSDGMSGIKPIIKAEEIRRIFEELAEEEQMKPENIVLARASIILPFSDVADDYGKIDAFPNQIYPCQYSVDQYGQKVFNVIKDIAATGTSAGLKNRSLSLYRCDVTTHIAKVKNKKTEELKDSDDLWILPLLISTANSATGASNVVPDASTYFVQQLNGNGSENAPRLEICYIVLDN